MTTLDTNIEGIVARVANVAVIFRRGPTRATQMLLWNLDTDEITPGQWTRARVDARNCDVTPEGRLLIAGYHDGRPHREIHASRHPRSTTDWIAVSRPPYFTALALWFDRSRMGGTWTSDRDIYLFGSLAERTPDQGSLPSYLRRRKFKKPLRGKPPSLESHLQRDGWKFLERTGDVTTWQLPFSGGRLLRIRTGDLKETLSLQEVSGHVRFEMTCTAPSWRWMALDERGRVIYGDQGCLWAWEDFPNGGPKLIADLNPHRFSSVETPDWAREWPLRGVQSGDRGWSMIEATLARIASAFAGVSREGGTSWSEAIHLDYGPWDGSVVTPDDPDRNWTELVDDYGWSSEMGEGFSFLDPIGFRYYLPVAMVRSLRNGYDESILFHLTLDGLGPPDEDEYWNLSLDEKHYIEKWSAFNEEQCATVAQFILTMEAISSNDEWDNVAEDWRLAYDRYWKKYGPESVEPLPNKNER